MFVFFFSSRRRHTRCSRDWSSDVCSSDLLRERGDDVILLAEAFLRKFSAQYNLPQPTLSPEVRRALPAPPRPGNRRGSGRAAWRGRGEISGGAGSLKKKKKEKSSGELYIR